MKDRDKSPRQVREPQAPYAAEAPADAPSEARLTLPIDAAQKELIEAAAAHLGETVSSYAISTLVRDARRVIEGEHAAPVSDRDWEILMDLMENPPEPNEALLAAMRHHREFVRSLDHADEE